MVTKPSQDVNGEDGTIQTGEYAKGDTATLYVVPDMGKVEVRILVIPLFFYLDSGISCKKMNTHSNFVNPSMRCFMMNQKYHLPHSNIRMFSTKIKNSLKKCLLVPFLKKAITCTKTSKS